MYIKKIGVGSLLVLFLTSCGTTSPVLEKYYSTRTAEKSDIDLTQSYVGYVESDIVTQLSSEVSGEVLDIKVHEGQSITQGQSLLEINVDTSAVAAAGAGQVVTSLVSMKESISQSFDTQGVVLQSQIKQAQIELAGSKTNLSDTLAIQEKQTTALQSSLELAQQNLELAEIEKEQSLNILETKKNDLYTNAKNALTGIMIIDTNVASYIDEVFEITAENRGKNDIYERFLGAKDIVFYNKTKTKANSIYNNFTAFEKLYNTSIKDSQPSEQEINIALDEALRLNNTLKSFLSDTYKVFENSVANDPYFKESDISNFKTKTSNFGVQIETALLSAAGNTFLGIQGIIQNIKSLEDEKQKTIALLDKKISLSQTNLENITKNVAITSPTQENQIHQNDTNTALIEEKIGQLQASIKNLEATKQARLNEIDSQITSSQVQKSVQSLAAGKGDITSPISGIITKKYVEVGNVVGAGQALLQVSDESSKKVSIEVSPEVLKNISLERSVKLLFEGEDDFLEGKISFIYPFQDETTRKTRIEIRTDALKEIPLGTRGEVYLTTAVSHGVTIPKKAIVSNFGVPGVYIIFNNQALFTHIEIIEENDQIALVSGIKEGTKIIFLGKENIFDGENISQYQELPE